MKQQWRLSINKAAVFVKYLRKKMTHAVVYSTCFGTYSSAGLWFRVVSGEAGGTRVHIVLCNHQALFLLLKSLYVPWKECIILAHQQDAKASIQLCWEKKSPPVSHSTLCENTGNIAKAMPLLCVWAEEQKPLPGYHTASVFWSEDQSQQQGINDAGGYGLALGKPSRMTTAAPKHY